MPNRHHGPPKRRLPMTWHAHNNHTPPLHAHPRLRHRDSATPTGGFTTIDTPPRRVAGVSRPYGRNSPHAPDEPKVACNSGARTFYSTPKRCNSNDVMSNLEIHAGELHATFLRNHNMRHHKGPKQKTAQAQNTPTARGERQLQHSRQPCARATTQHPAHPAPRPYTTSPPQHSQTPPRLGHANGGFYYHRHPATACRRRVAPLWSQFPPRAHPQPPTTRPSNNAAPRTPRATPMHNLTIAAFADATSTPSAPIGEPRLRAYPYADSLPSAPCPTATATPPTPTTEPEL